jgi:NADPH-dependent 7-cyano-7-deazaguanine reductase QueF
MTVVGRFAVRGGITSQVVVRHTKAAARRRTKRR